MCARKTQIIPAAHAKDDRGTLFAATKSEITKTIANVTIVFKAYFDLFINISF